MAINFPTSIDSLTNPISSNTLDNPSHAGQHSDANDAIEALETKVGVNSSAVSGSIDYKLTNTSSSNPGHKHTLANGATDVTASAAELNQLDDVSVGGTSSGDVVTIDGTQTLTNKTINGDNNTITNLAHGSEVDNPSSGVHGITGNVVGTTDTQTLTNKTLLSPKINEDVALTSTSTELNYVDGVTSAIQTQLNSKQGDIKFTLLASGKVTDTTNGVTISNIGNSGIYLIFTEGWAASTSGKAGFAICSNISGGYGYVDTIKSGTYSGTVTMPSATSINIKPYNGDGCIYSILRLALW